MGFVPINTDHLTPRINPVPLGAIDAFGRDDGWIGDRPADCGNFWIPRGNILDPPYLSSGQMAITPGLSSLLGSIWLGGSDAAVAFDVATGPDLSSTKGIFCYIVAADRPEFSGDQIIASLFSSVSHVQRSSGGVLTDFGTGGASLASTAYRVYVSARNVGGGQWYVRVEASAPDGSSRGPLVSGLVDSTATTGWLSLSTSSGMSGVAFGNVERIALLGGYFADDFDSGLAAGWTANQGTWSTDGSGYAYSTSGNDGDFLTRDFGQADMVSRVTLPAVPSGMGASIANRYIDANNFFLFSIDHTANVLGLAQRVSGTTTGLGTHSVTYAAGDILELTTIGTSVIGRLIRGGSVFDTISTTSSALSTATRTGIRTGYTPSGSVRFNDFTVYG